MSKKKFSIFIIIFIVFLLILLSYKLKIISAKFSLLISFLLLGGMHILVGFFIALEEKNFLEYLNLIFTFILGVFFLIVGVNLFSFK